MGKQEPHKRKVIVQWEGEGFDLHLNKEDAQLVNLLFTTFYKVSNNPINLMSDHNRKVVEEMDDLCDRFIKPYHESGFCEDPECTYFEDQEE